MVQSDDVAVPGEGMPSRGALVRAGETLVDKLLSVGIDGSGPWKSAEDVTGTPPADPDEIERQVKQLVATHRRLVAVGGFATGLGGLATLPISLPADLLSFYTVSARMTAGIARLRGYDVDSPYVRSAVLVSLLGAQGTAVLGEMGAQAGTRFVTASLRKLPGRTLVKINQAVGFRLVTKAGQKGVINLTKVVPLVGGGVGAGVNAAAITMIARYAKQNFPLRDAEVFAVDDVAGGELLGDDEQ